MNMTIFIAVIILGLGIGILLTARNKPISRGSESVLLHSIKTAEEVNNLYNIQKEEGPLQKILQNNKKTKSTEELLTEYLNPDKMKENVKKQKMTFLAIGGVIAAVLFVILEGQMKIAGIVVPLVLYVAPEMIFNNKRKQIQQDVINCIPDLLGYMAIFIANMSVYKTMVLILDHIDDDNILYASLRQSVKEHQFGRDLFESLDDQANLLGVQEWMSCVFAMNEGVRLGKDLRTVMLEIEEDYRNERKLRLEMDAAKVTTKLSIISSVLFMPAIYTYTLVPAYMELGKIL